MFGFLQAENSPGIFLLVTVILGGGTAALAGRAIAATWRPWWQMIIYSFILGAVARFLHYALFEGTLLTLQYYLLDTAVCLVFGLIGFRAARAGQMVRRYPWLNEPAGPLRWRRKSP